MEKVRCIACLKDKPLSAYNVDKRRPTGYRTRCKMCFVNGITKSKDPLERIPSDRSLKLSKVTKEDYLNSFIMLEQMGYDIKQDIHKQFCLKHGLEPKEKYQYDDINYYSVENLFDFS